MRRAEVGFALVVLTLGLALWWAAVHGAGWTGWPGWPPQGLGWLLLPLYLLAGLVAGAIFLVVGLTVGLVGAAMAMAAGLLAVVMVLAMLAAPLGVVVLVVYLLIRGRRPAAKDPMEGST